MNLDQSMVLVDRALVTLCAELPESLGLYHTARDQITVGAIRSVPMLEHITPGSKKHFIIRDWMRSYEDGVDQMLTNEISLDSLRQTMKMERKQRARETREQNKKMMPREGSDENAQAKSSTRDTEKSKKNKKKNGKAPATSGNHKKTRKRIDHSDSEVSDSDTSTSSNPSDSLDDDEESSSSGSDVEEVPRPKSKGKTKAKERKRSHGSGNGSATGSKRKSTKKSKKHVKSNLPPLEVVLSSDEDDEDTNGLFDTEDPDVYEVETILDKRVGRDYGEQDLYKIKWVGYEETTWEPAENVSPDLIEEFESQTNRENEFVVEEILDRKTVRDKATGLKTFKYLVKWVGYTDKTWEPAENLPHNLRRKYDQKYTARKRRRT